MRHHVSAITVVLLLALASGKAFSESTGRYPLVSTEGLSPHNVEVEAVKLQGQSGVRVTISDAERKRFSAMSSEDRQQVVEEGKTPEQLVIIAGTDFSNGVIEAEVAGMPQDDIFKGARGFVGIAFRVQKDLKTYDAFYLRPTNGRASEQVRRNRSAQYISHPDWTWFRFRRESPGQYESYVDLVPGEWTKIKIDVEGKQARLYVNGASQPTLVVNDLKSGEQARGSVALWLDIGTVAHFRNVTVIRR